MKIDLSTIFLVALVVSPGFFALRGRGKIAPDTLRQKGASEEIAELVAFSLVTQGVQALMAWCALAIAGLFRASQPLYFVREIDAGALGSWAVRHVAESTLLGFGYLLLSFLASHTLGILYGAADARGRLTAWLIRHLPQVLVKGVTGTLGETPILYDLLNTAPGADAVFVEAEMKAGIGFYSGQVSQFAIVKDEEAHRPIYLIDPYYKKDRDSNYEKVSTDGVLFDLADVAVLLIKQSAVSTLQQEPGLEAAEPLQSLGPG